MKIKFLGTRGYIDARTRRHYRHTSTMVSYRKTRVMVDCGIDWQKKVWQIKPTAIVITHAHPDHAWGLKEGSPCPVYATKESWALMEKYPIKPRYKHVVKPYRWFSIGQIKFKTFPVVHSILAPGVGYRIEAGKAKIFCVHDLISIDERHKALHNVQLYIGDGATLTRPMVRRKGDKLFGHTTIRAQIGWCQKEGVPRAIFTHCGSQIVTGDGRTLSAEVRRMGKERRVEASIAYDGLEVNLL